MATLAAKRHFVGFCNRVAYATVLGLAAWGLMMWPPFTPLAGRIYGYAAILLDLPIALANLLLPLDWRGLDLVFDRGLTIGTSTPGFLFRHLRVAIPVYVLLFYLPSLLLGSWRRWRRRGRAVESEPAAQGN